MIKANKPLIIAHRGASGDAPENTIAAFQLAIAQKCDGIELDVHVTKDGKLVVIHDEDIKRTTNGEGLVAEMTASELKKLDAGSWFSSRFKGEKIPLLSEVFELVPKEIFINIEIKNIPTYYVGIEEKLLQVLMRMDRVNQVIVSSFDHQCLYQLKKKNKYIRIGLLYSENIVDHTSFARLFGFPVFSLHPNYQAIQEKDIQKALAHDLHVFPWTVNSKNMMRKLIHQGVSGIITNFPKKLQEVMEEEYGDL